MEHQLAYPVGDSGGGDSGGSDTSSDWNLPNAWRIPIENILKRADQVWPYDTSNEDAIKMRNGFVSLFKQDRQPLSAFGLIRFLNFWNSTAGEFNLFKGIIAEIWRLLGFPIDVQITLNTLAETKITAANFDEITDKALAIEQFRGFPTDDEQYRYCHVIMEFWLNAHSSTPFQENVSGRSNGLHPARGQEEQKTVRRRLQIEFNSLNHLQHFVNSFNAVATIYRSSKHRTVLKKLAELVGLVRFHNTGPNIGSEQITALAQEAKTLQTKINYSIFNGLPVCSGCIRSIQSFLKDLSELQATSLSLNTREWKTAVTGIDTDCNIWRGLFGMTKDRRPLNEQLTPSSFNKKLTEIAKGDLTYYKPFWEQ